jgi:predicted nucleic acid-binding protein
VAASALLIDTDILIDYLKSIQPACALLDSAQFDYYYSSWTRKELLATNAEAFANSTRLEFSHRSAAPDAKVNFK